MTHKPTYVPGETDYFYRGALDFTKGVRCVDNPFIDQRQRIDWVRGWMMEQRETERRKLTNQ